MCKILQNRDDNQDYSILGLREEDLYLAFDAPLTTLKVELDGKTEFVEAAYKSLNGSKQIIQRLVVCGKCKNSNDYRRIAQFVDEHGVRVLDLSQMEGSNLPDEYGAVASIHEIYQAFLLPISRLNFNDWDKNIPSALKLILLPKFQKIADDGNAGYDFDLDTLNSAGFVRRENSNLYFGDISVPGCIEIKGLRMEATYESGNIAPAVEKFAWKIKKLTLKKSLQDNFWSKKLLESEIAEFVPV